MDPEQVRQLIEAERARPLQYLYDHFTALANRSTKGYRISVESIPAQIEEAATLFGITLNSKPEQDG